MSSIARYTAAVCVLLLASSSVSSRRPVDAQTPWSRSPSEITALGYDEYALSTTPSEFALLMRASNGVAQAVLRGQVLRTADGSAEYTYHFRDSIRSSDVSLSVSLSGGNNGVRDVTMTSTDAEATPLHMKVSYIDTLCKKVSELSILQNGAVVETLRVDPLDPQSLPTRLRQYESASVLNGSTGRVVGQVVAASTKLIQAEMQRQAAVKPARQDCSVLCFRMMTLLPLFVCDGGFWQNCYCPCADGTYNLITGCDTFTYCYVQCSNFGCA